jgi:hypothetical protein
MINERALAAEADRKAALVTYEDAQKTLAGLDPKVYADRVTAAEAARKEATFQSQLHTFTAMIFGKDPDQVSEGELHWFLRLFVFLPAICVSFSSTLLALTAVERFRKKPQLADDAGAFLLGPLARVVVEEANRTVERTAAEVMRDAHAQAARAAASAPPPQRPEIVDDKIIPMGGRA